MTLIGPLEIVRMVKNKAWAGKMTEWPASEIIKFTVASVIMVAVVGMAMWLASECNVATHYVIAFFFPEVYIPMRLLYACK